MSSAARVKSIRDSFGVSQERFAAMLGKKRLAIGQWESGKAEPSAEAWIAIAKIALDKSPEKALACLVRAGLDIHTMHRLMPLVSDVAGTVEGHVVRIMQSISDLPTQEKDFILSSLLATAYVMR